MEQISAQEQLLWIWSLFLCHLDVLMMISEKFKIPLYIVLKPQNYRAVILWSLLLKVKGILNFPGGYFLRDVLFVTQLFRIILLS